MLALRATQKLLGHLPVQPAEPAGPTTTALGDWYAVPLFVGKQRYVLTASERSLLAVIVPLKEARTLVDRWRARVAERLDALGVEPEHRDRELAAMGDGVVAKTASRRILGAMNDLGRHARWMAQDEGGVYPDEIEFRLDRMPCGLLAYAYSADIARYLLEQQYTTVREPGRVYVLKVAPVAQPQIWRTIKVSGSHTLHRIHEFIEDIFNRFEPHLYAFYLVPPDERAVHRAQKPKASRVTRERDARSRGRLSLVPDEPRRFVHPYLLKDAPFEEGWAEDASRTKVRQLALREGQVFEYLFDFGDDIRHRVTVESIAPDGGDQPIRPVVIERHGEIELPDDDVDSIDDLRDRSR